VPLVSRTPWVIIISTERFIMKAVNRCPKCNHWPYSGSHEKQGCFATGGTLIPCGCTYKGNPVKK
jgi:hypothetical protein